MKPHGRKGSTDLAAVTRLYLHDGCDRVLGVALFTSLIAGSGCMLMLAPARRWSGAALAACGLSTVTLSYLLACGHPASPYECGSLRYLPTLSYAAHWSPIARLFGCGMAITAILSVITTVLFGSFFLSRVGKHAPLWNTALGVLQIASGVVASGALLCLAVYNMRVHERTHVRCGLAFFSTNWLQVLLAWLCLRELSFAGDGNKPGKGPLGRSGEETGQMGKGSIADARTRALRASRWLFVTANTATALFGVTFALVNVRGWKELTGMEAVFETVAVVAQLLFMGLLSTHMHLHGRSE